MYATKHMYTMSSHTFLLVYEIYSQCLLLYRFKIHNTAAAANPQYGERTRNTMTEMNPQHDNL